VSVLASAPPVGDPDALGDLSAAARADLDAAARHFELAEGEALFREGDEARRVYAIEHGRLKVTQGTPDGREVVLNLAGPGDVLGCSALLRRPAHPASAVAVSYAEVQAWPAPVMQALMARHADLTAAMLGVVGRRFEELRGRFTDLATQQVEQRLARALVRLAHQLGRRTGEGIVVEVSREDLAALTGTTVFSASRILADWSRRGLIGAPRGRIVIARPHEVTSLAEGIPDALLR